MRRASVCAGSLARNGIYTRAWPLLNRFWRCPPRCCPLYCAMGGDCSRKRHARFRYRISREEFDATNHAAISRRPCRQSVATRRAEGSACQTRTQRDFRGRACARSRIAKSRRSIKKQEEVGLKLATDGEFRRSWWHFDFFRGLDGVTFYTTDAASNFTACRPRPKASRSPARSAFPAIRCWSTSNFSRRTPASMPKMTIPAPSTFHFRQGRASISNEVYPDARSVFRRPRHGLSRRDPRVLRRRAAAICSSTTPLGPWCAIRTSAPNRRTRGDDPDALPKRYARLTNAALEGKPADMAITMHSCRGNFRSTFIASGGYEFVAEQLARPTPASTAIFSNTIPTRAGGFEPLRFFPKGKKQIVLGLVTSKSGALEKKRRHQASHRRGDQIRRSRSALPVAAMRLRLDRRGQCSLRGRAMGASCG